MNFSYSTGYPCSSSYSFSPHHTSLLLSHCEYSFVLSTPCAIPKMCPLPRVLVPNAKKKNSELLTHKEGYEYDRKRQCLSFLAFVLLFEVTFSSSIWIPRRLRGHGAKGLEENLTCKTWGRTLWYNVLWTGHVYTIHALMMPVVCVSPNLEEANHNLVCTL